MTELERRLEEKRQSELPPNERRYHELLKRIVDGAHKIEKMDKDDPNYDKYMKLYDELYEEAGELRKVI